MSSLPSRTSSRGSVIPQIQPASYCIADGLDHIYGGLLHSSSITLAVLQTSTRLPKWFGSLSIEAQSPAFALWGASWFKLF
ncbi:hypothetical protein GJ744_012351 [Endocarpon pusillum]|uniref:Uncharacterized protein n=1 Tax=Endocarpon pusillum TaxID=364733 RepID=A0A8H7E0F0_9EURO|nr:hypothetical protein GJ744_012351 [Endocarpon pusillum]